MLILGFVLVSGVSTLHKVFFFLWAWWVHPILHIFNTVLICRRGFAPDVTQKNSQLNEVIEDNADAIELLEMQGG